MEYEIHQLQTVQQNTIDTANKLMSGLEQMMHSLDRRRKKLEGEQDASQQLGATQARLIHAESSLETQNMELAVGLEKAHHVLAAESELNSIRAQQLNDRATVIEASADAAAAGNDWYGNFRYDNTPNDWSNIVNDWWPRAQEPDSPPNPGARTTDTRENSAPLPWKQCSRMPKSRTRPDLARIYSGFSDANCFGGRICIVQSMINR